MFCGRQYLKDTPDFLRKLMKYEDALCAPGVQLFSLDYDLSESLSWIFSVTTWPIFLRFCMKTLYVYEVVLK